MAGSLVRKDRHLCIPNISVDAPISSILQHIVTDYTHPVLIYHPSGAFWLAFHTLPYRVSLPISSILIVPQSTVPMKSSSPIALMMSAWSIVCSSSVTAELVSWSALSCHLMSVWPGTKMISQRIYDVYRETSHVVL